MKLIIVSALIFLLSGSAWATNTCLEDASNSELVDELSRRLYTSEPDGEAILNATCSGWNLTLSTANVDTGAENSLTISAGSSQKCRELSDQLNNKLGNIILTKTVVVATCSSWNLSRVLVKKNGQLKALEEKSVGSSDRCRAEAKRINSRW